MDPTTLLAFFNSNPIYRQEWDRVRTQNGDRRSEAQWMQDHLNSSAGAMARQEFNQWMDAQQNGGVPTSGNLDYNTAVNLDPIYENAYYE